MKKLVLTFFIVSVLLSIVVLFVGVAKTEPQPVLTPPHPHLYNDAETPITTISITVFYFIPKDKLTLEKKDWQMIVELHLRELQVFHDLQFSKTSRIAYRFFPVPIIGEKKSDAYITLSDHASSEALTPIREELERRVFATTGDLHTSYEAATSSAHTRNVNLVVYEGQGGAGNGTFCLVSMNYLHDALYQTVGTTYMAHEFYHTLLVPDHYQKSSYVYTSGEQVPVSILTKRDIMGEVNVPIADTYLDREVLTKMGL